MKFYVVVLMSLLVTSSVLGQGSPAWVIEEVGHSNSVTAEAFSPDGTHYVTGSSDQTILVRVAITGQEVRRLKGHSGTINSLAFSPDGNIIASASSDQTIRLWDVSSGLEVGIITGHSGGVTSIEFSPDGSQFVSGSVDASIRLWNAENRQEIRRFTGHSQPVLSVSFHPDGDLLVSGAADQTIRIWNISTGEEEQILTGHTDGVTSVAFSPSSSIIASGSLDRTVRLWDLETGNEALAQPISLHEGPVNALSFSSDGRWMASVSQNRVLMVTEFRRSGALQITRVDFSQNLHPFRSVRFSPDGNFMTLGAGIETESNRRFGLSFVNDFAEFARNRTISAEFYLAPTVLTYSVDFSADGSLIASGSWDGTLRLTSLKGDVVRRFPTGNLTRIRSVAISPDGRHLVSSSSDSRNSLRIWDTSSFIVLDSLSEQSQIVLAVAFSPDSDEFVTGSTDGRIQLWDVESGEVITQLSAPSIQVNSVAYSPDGNLLASGSNDQTVRLWDLRDQTELHALSDHRGPVNSVAFSPTDNLLVSGSADAQIRVWNTSTGQLVRQITGHLGQVSSVAISPDGTHIISGSFDGSVRVWNLSNGQELQRFEHGAAILSVDISSNGENIISAGENSVQLWELNNTLQFTSAIEDQTYTVGQTITPLPMPEVTGGLPPITYTLQPLPTDGLNYDRTTRRIVGTPTTISTPQLFTYTGTDSRGLMGKLTFQIEVIAPVSVEHQELPEVFTIVGNYPNPFQESTQLLFDLPGSATVQLEVMDVIGRRVLTLPPISHRGGWSKSITIGGESLTAGVYLYRLTATSDFGTSIRTGQIVRIR